MYLCVGLETFARLTCLQLYFKFDVFLRQILELAVQSFTPVCQRVSQPVQADFKLSALSSSLF